MTTGVGWGECHAPSGTCRGGSSFFASSSFRSPQTFLGLCIVPLIATWHPAPSHHIHLGFPLSVSLLPRPPYKDTGHIGFRPPFQPHHGLFSVKTLFPNLVASCGSGGSGLQHTFLRDAVLPLKVGGQRRPHSRLGG